MGTDRLRNDARAIWDAAVAAVRPDELVGQAVATGPLATVLAAARRIIVVGGGKAGAAMAAGLETGLSDRLDRIEGIVNIPAGTERPLKRIRLNVARPAGINEPTLEGQAGADRMLELASDASADDVVICLLSGGGSALLPAPVVGVSVEDKQATTRLLHHCGATIVEMNAVRKHLSRIKGGGLADACKAASMYSLIISDVVGDPLDVIASGPTAPDPTTFADAVAVLRRYDLLDCVPSSVRRHLERGAAGGIPETPKSLPPLVHNLILGNNARALAAARSKAETLGYAVVDLGPNVEGETRMVAESAVRLANDIATKQTPIAPPACILIGGETTVTLTPDHGKGGRNTEFVLAALLALEHARLDNVVVLSGGTDGEDGPTHAAGAVADVSSFDRARALGLDPAASLARHDSFTFLEGTGDLIVTGLTHTNVMDVRVILVGGRT